MLRYAFPTASDHHVVRYASFPSSSSSSTFCLLLRKALLRFTRNTDENRNTSNNKKATHTTQYVHDISRPPPCRSESTPTENPKHTPTPSSPAPPSKASNSNTHNQSAMKNLKNQTKPNQTLPNQVSKSAQCVPYTSPDKPRVSTPPPPKPPPPSPHSC